MVMRRAIASTDHDHNHEQLSCMVMMHTSMGATPRSRVSNAIDIDKLTN